jgi:hypothetical protein
MNQEAYQYWFGHPHRPKLAAISRVSLVVPRKMI